MQSEIRTDQDPGVPPPVPVSRRSVEAIAKMRGAAGPAALLLAFETILKA
jgi:hypothetical protein